MFKLDLEKAEESEIKLPTSIWSSKKAREFQKNIYFCFIDYAKAFDYVDHHKVWKILKEMGIPHHLTCLLRNLYAGQEATGRTGHGTMGWFQIGKEVYQGCILSPCFISVQSLSRVWLFVTPWVTAHQASLFITNSQSSLRLTAMSHKEIEQLTQDHTITEFWRQLPKPTVRHQNWPLFLSYCDT